MKNAACDRYGLAPGHRSRTDPDGRRRPYQVDHLVPLELGGAPDAIANLWPQPIADARRKNHIENMLHKLVRSGRMSLPQAQAAIANNWETAVPDREK